MLGNEIGGKVVLLLTINHIGDPIAVSIADSSQNVELDKAAMVAAKRLMFPLHYPDGSTGPKCYMVLLPLEFDPEMRPNNSFKPTLLRKAA